MSWLQGLLDAVGTSSAATAGAAGTAGAAAAGAANSGFGAGIPTIGGTGTVQGLPPPSVAGGQSLAANLGPATVPGGGAASLLSRLYGPVGNALKTGEQGLEKMGTGSPWEGLGNAVGGKVGASVGRAIGGLGKVAGSSPSAAAPSFPLPLRNQRPLPPPLQAPVVGSAAPMPPAGIGSLTIDSQGFVAHPGEPPPTATGPLPVRVGY